jgi:hypothetical protein
MSQIYGKQLRSPLEVTASWANNAVTASYALFAANGGGSVNTSSLLTTASVSLNTITFTKGDGSTFPITVNTGSGVSGDYVTTSSFNAFTSSYNTGSFTGSFTGSLFGTSSLAINAITSSRPIAVTGSTIYSTSPGTTPANTNNNILLGGSAGNNASRIGFSNFLGNGAGSSAGSASYSNFLGINAGIRATNAADSNFFGAEAGKDATNASYTTLIGHKVGLNAGAGSIGSNNIIIGTNITLPVGAANSINLGGVLFGTGTYSSIFDQLSGSAGGRIGINIVSPQYTLDVSGSGNYTNGLTVTGSLIAPTITGSLQGTASWATNFVSASNYVLNSTTSSFVTTSSFNSFTQSINRATSSFLTTGSSGTSQTISGSLVINQNLTVLGSASITFISESTLNIGTNLITVNTATPAIRFGGLAVIDSGSSPLVSASFLYDSVQDEFLFVHKGTAGGVLTSSIFLLGPETFNNIGNETYLTQNRIPKGTGIEHLNDSNISDNGSVVSINSNTQVIGSLLVSGLATINGSANISTDLTVTGSVNQGLNNINFTAYSHVEGNNNYAGLKGYTFTGASAGVITFEVGSDISGEIGNYVVIDDTTITKAYKVASSVYDTGGLNPAIVITLEDTSFGGSGKVASILTRQLTGGTEIVGYSYGHAEGESTTVTGQGAHSAGSVTTAVGRYSYAGGEYTIANSDSQIVVGRYNQLTNGQGTFVIGNGTSDLNRSNLLYASGSQVQITGSLIVSGSSTFTNIGPAIFSGSITSTEGFTGSLQGIATTASYINPTFISSSAAASGFGSGGSTNTGSLLTTASVSLNTITFRKGDGSTFPITVDTGSSSGGGISQGKVVAIATGYSNLF